MHDAKQLPQFTLEQYETEFPDRHRLHDVVTKWAQSRPNAPALIGAENDRSVSWREFDRFTTALALELLGLGFTKGDFLATLLPLTIDHVLLEYGCFKIGVIVAPLDLHLSPPEVVRALERLRPRGFAGMGSRPPFNLEKQWKAVQTHCAWIERCIAMEGELEGALSFASLADPAWKSVEAGPATAGDLALLARQGVSEEDGALVIFTTGSTGSPKPALLSHRNITAQNMCVVNAFFHGDRGARNLINLPPSHVAGQNGSMMSSFFGRGTAILLESFDAHRSLRAVERHRAQIMGQIPAMYHLEWMLNDYDRYDLSSLIFVAYGGNAVSRHFVDRLMTMAPVAGTGLALTETAGFCTWVRAEATEREKLVGCLGQDMPIYPCSIRHAMNPDGSAGDTLPDGEIGHLCFRGPQTFLGYVNDAEASARSISRDGFLYTGDLGYRDADGLHLTGRAKWVIKSLGHQIFPGDVEAHICGLKEKVATCVAVGVTHAVAGEAVVALVEMRPGVELTVAELDRHARALAPYMRPRHWILLDPGQMPLNRVMKPNHLRAQEIAREEIAQLRTQGAWDSAFSLSVD